MVLEGIYTMRIQHIVDWLADNNFSFRFVGNPEQEIKGFSSLENYQTGRLTWIKKRENYLALKDRVNITCAVIQDELDVDIPNRIISYNSKEVFFAILHHFWGKNKPAGFIGRGTVTEGNISIHPSVYIGYNCSIIGDVTIGDGTRIGNNVVICGKVTIGENCQIQSCSVIGEDGFGYSIDVSNGEKTMIEHLGGVQIGNDVFIGSHVNVACGTIDDTVISDGVKISPSTHIGHNCLIEKNATVICSNLFGSVQIGENSYITASTIKNQTTVGRRSLIGMGSVVTKPIPDNMIAYGIPAKIVKENDLDL